MSGESLTVLFAPDSFKGSLTSVEVAKALAAGWTKGRPADELLLSPLADGGEGTLESIAAAGGWEWRETLATDPIGRSITGRWLRSTDGRGAVIELAQASGLSRLGPDERDPIGASTRGTGEIIKAALDTGCPEILLGIGGSATNDGGRGILVSLGARIVDDRIQLEGLDPRLGETNVRVACDVTNPLLGPAGAAATYGPQKGATSSQVAELDAALSAWADALEAATGRHERETPGAGAAGGVGFGLLAIQERFRSFALKPGVDLVMEATRIRREARPLGSCHHRRRPDRRADGVREDGAGGCAAGSGGRSRMHRGRRCRHARRRRGSRRARGDRRADERRADDDRRGDGGRNGPARPLRRASLAPRFGRSSMRSGSPAGGSPAGRSPVRRTPTRRRRKPDPNRAFARRLQRTRPGLVEFVFDGLVTLYGSPSYERRNDPTSELVLTILAQNSADTNAEAAFESLRRRYPYASSAEAADGPPPAAPPPGWGGVGVRPGDPPDWMAVEIAPVEELADAIRPGGLHNLKAPRIQAALRTIRETRGDHSLEFLGAMEPADALAFLTAIPGTGVKTASIVLLFCFRIPYMPVDRHVERVSKRLGLVPAKASPDEAHTIFAHLLAPDRVFEAHVNLITHGRRICHSQRPEHERCPLIERCRFVHPGAP